MRQAGSVMHTWPSLPRVVLFLVGIVASLFPVVYYIVCYSKLLYNIVLLACTAASSTE